MKALSETVGVEEGAVRALAAGADGLLLGHELGEAELESVRAALVGGVRAGRVPEERLAEAAARVGAALRGLPPADVSSRDDSVGLDAARLAISASGSVAVSGPALVVELSPEPTIAAGAAEHGLGDSLRRRAPNTVTVRLDEESGSGATSVLARYPERQLVVVVRDAHRHKWQQRTAESLRDAAHGDAILVETGLPVWKPPAARGRLVTHGHGRVNLEAAAELLLGTS
jgi:beta-N-acetylhexosaminidase